MRKLVTLVGLASIVLSACSANGAAPSASTAAQSQARHIALPQGQAGRRPMDSNGNLADPGFESGGFTYWQQCGNANASITTAKPHSGSYSERSGTTVKPEVNGDSGVCQQIKVPSGGHITFWVYQGTNETNTTYAYEEADLLDSNGYVLKNFYETVSTTSAWKQLSYDASAYAGQTVWLYFGVHGNGWTGGYIYQYVDDVAWAGSATPTPSPKPSSSPTPTPKPSSSPTPTPRPSTSPTGSPTPTPAPTSSPAWPCNDQQFLTDQTNFGNGTISADQPVDVCGAVTQVLPSKTTTSGLHGYFYMQIKTGDTIEVVSNLDEMNAPAWPWVAVGDYVYVQGRYYYDNSSSQGIDWTHHGTSSSWPQPGYVVVCNSSGGNCVEYQ